MKKKIAECYQQLGLIHEMKGNLVMAIEEREKFLDITKEQNDAVAQSEAHKLLAETYSKDNNISKAIQHLNQVVSIVMEKTNDNNATSEATLKLGLLFDKEGPKRNPKKSVEYLGQHFDLLLQQQDSI